MPLQSGTRLGTYDIVAPLGAGGMGEVSPAIEIEKAVALKPNEDIWLAQLGEAYALAGRTDEARAVLRRLEDPARAAPPSPYHLAYVHVGLGDLDRAMGCLERAFESGAAGMLGIKASFLLEPLRDHPRFVRLLQHMKLA